MFISCPHCRYLVATDPRTQQAPAHCPRCGGLMTPESAAPSSAPETAHSFASLLRRGESQAEVAPDAGDGEETAADPIVVESVDETAAALHPEADAGADSVAEPHTREAEAPSIDNLMAAPDAEAVAAPPAPTIPDAAPVAASAPARNARVPGFLHAAGSRSHGGPDRARWPWLVLPLLIALLIVQILLADRDRFAADAQWRPVVSALCGVLGCSLPAWHEPQAFAMLDRDVRPLSGSPGLLEARATFRNDARWPQRWPVLVLTLKDADGRTLGARALTPADYLEAGGSSELAPGQSAQVVVHVREPSTNVVAFSFDFR